jgi:drug/metabolite transporter (DMT)-like permease
MNKKRWGWVILIAAGVICVIISFFIPAEEHAGNFWWSHIWGVYALIGFVGCAAMIFIAKWLGRFWLQRKDDYYD